MTKKLRIGILSLVFLLVLSVPVFAGETNDNQALSPTGQTLIQPAVDSVEEGGTVLASYDEDYDYEDEDSGGGFFAGVLFTLFGAPLLSLGICLFMVSLNKSASKQRAAHNYVNDGEVVVHVQEDRFTHQTRHVEKINKSN